MDTMMSFRVVILEAKRRGSMISRKSFIDGFRMMWVKD